MGSYSPVLYHHQLCVSCVRAKRALRRAGLEVEYRDILFSRHHRQELREILGQLEVPCLVISGTVVRSAEEIEKYLRLRYGQGEELVGRRRG